MISLSTIVSALVSAVFVVGQSPGQGGLRAAASWTAGANPLNKLQLSPIVHAAHVYVVAFLFVATILGLVIAITVLIRSALKPAARYLLSLRGQAPTNKLSFLELTFPADKARASFATSQLYSLFGPASSARSWLERLAAHPTRYSLEIVATQDEGIRVIMAVPESQVMAIYHGLTSYMPGISIRQTRDYLDETHAQARITQLELSGDYVLPLKAQGELVVHDPIAYIAGQMSRLASNELIGYQLVLTPIMPDTHATVTTRLKFIRTRLVAGHPISPVLARPHNDPAGLRALLWALERLTASILFIMDLAVRGSHRHEITPVEQDGPRDLSKYEQQLADAVQSKIDAQLFEVSIRLFAARPDPIGAQARMLASLTPFRLFTSPHQSLTAVASIAIKSHHQLASSAYSRRALTRHKAPTILSAGELADLYHFPDTSRALLPGLAKARIHDLPIPKSVETSLVASGALYGIHHFEGVRTPLRIGPDQRARHTYVFGRTGTGKTTLLTHAIYDDIDRGMGLAVLDPHGDMFHDLIGLIPHDRRADVVVFDPAERDWPVGINLLNPGIAFKDEIEAKDRITSAVIAVFQKLSDEGKWGPRMEHILRNATLTALTLPNPNLFTLQRLLTDRRFGEQVAADLDDPVLKQFWEKEIARAGDFQVASYTAPLTHRLGKFLTTGMSRHILLQKHTTISMSSVMDEGRILLVNLSKGELGEDESNFFGTIMTSFVWMAALARASQPAPGRRPFALYVDEFQNFATRNFAEIASEGRKYAISLTLSHQSVAQITDRAILKVIAGNAGTIISFAGSPDDDLFIQPFMAPLVERGDITNLPPHHFVIRVKDLPDSDAFSGVTEPLTIKPSAQLAAQVTHQSRLTYGVHRGLLDAYLEDLFGHTREPKQKSKPAQQSAGEKAAKQKAKLAPALPKSPSKPAVRLPRIGRRNSGYEYGELQASQRSTLNDAEESSDI
jgi:hypothetical protein